MPGDYTRFSFSAQSDYSGVFKQQGRVDLDADFNELVDIVDRRWRSETIDVIGHGVVPRVPPATPPAFDPFLVIPSAIGDFQIGIGRMYVDGVQVENHGLAPFSYRADLGELRGTVPPLYSNQPYLPAPLPPVLPGTAGTSDLIYIDVWQREVTALEDPALREIALGGPDTTTRLQSVWQVRALLDVGSHGCGDTISAWDQLIAPSAGRLSVTAVAPPSSDDPCILSPSGGYRGLENRLYRVEIHAPGTIGGGAPARFKWARDNANVAASVTAIPAATQIIVQQLGRDQVLRFAPGNWIEITDDHRELAGLGGHMAQITQVDEANRTLTFTPAIGGMSFNAADPARHTRVRRWDSNGLLDVVAGPIDIEQGIRVEFALDPAGGNFKIGDYWSFAARTADGSVEELVEAPPRGILHHYCRLGFIHWGATLATTTFTDCRVRWPPSGDCGCCTVTVGDGVDSFGDFTDIQQAIDSLGNRGGVVCVGRGFYRVTRTIIINNTKRNVIVKGMGPATRIVFEPDANNPGPFLEIVNTEQVRIENLFVAAAGASSLVRINQSNFCRIEDCTLVNLQPRGDDNAPAPRAVDFTENCSYCVIARCAIVAGKAVSAMQGELRELLMRDNIILAQRMAVVMTRGHGIEITHNQIRGLPRGVLPGVLTLTRDNMDAFQQALSAQLRAPSTLANLPAIGVFIFSGQRVVITQNLISAHLAVGGFLFINLRVMHNDIVSLIGVLQILALRVKIEDNFMLALFAGVLQAGVSFDLDVTSNEMLGLNGVVFMTLRELVTTLAPLLIAALGAGGLGGAGGFGSMLGAISTGGALAAGLSAIGLVLFTKIHRNVFLSLTRGVYKTDATISADMSIVDNTFSICRLAAIELGGGTHNAIGVAALRNAIPLRHLVQGNAIAVQGKGVVSSTLLTDVVDNDIQSRLNGIEFDAAECSAQRNLVLGTAAAPGPAENGFIVLGGSCTQARVCGNRLMNAPSHAILILEDVFEVTIEDNEIELARGHAIGTLSNTTEVRGARISRNRIRGCNGVPARAFAGVVSLGRTQDLRFTDNVITGNRPLVAPGTVVLWSIVYVNDMTDVDFDGNSIVDNLPNADTQGRFWVLLCEEPKGVIRIQNNVVRGNGGSVIEMQPLSFAFLQRDLMPRALIQDNHFSAGIRRTLHFIRFYFFDSLLFQGNRCLEESRDAFIQLPMYFFVEQANVSNNNLTFAAPTALYVNSNFGVVNGNTVQSGPRALEFRGSPTGASRAIVTANLTSGLITSSTGTVLRIHNIPGP
jgi:hypothetical protein